MSHQNFRALYQKLWIPKILELEDCNLYLQKKLPNFIKNHMEIFIIFGNLIILNKTKSNQMNLSRWNNIIDADLCFFTLLYSNIYLAFDIFLCYHLVFCSVVE